MAQRLEDRIAALYGLPLDEFTAARDALAKEAPKEERARIKALRKPSAPVWAANQLARREPGGVNALLRAGARVRETQAAALAGKGAEGLRDAVANQRRAVGELMDVARDRLGLSGAALDRLAVLLQAASADDASRELLKAGTLADEVEPTGFEALAGMPAAPRKAKAKPAPKAKPKPKRDLERERRLRELKADVARLERELERARKRLEDEEGRA